MGTELIRTCLPEEDLEIPSVPPGFESLAPFTLRRVNDNKDMISYSASTNASESQSAQMETEGDGNDAGKLTRSLRRRPWINYSQFDNSSEDECDCVKLDHNFLSKLRLPRGIIRGCSECSNCQKVMARWRPDDACRPDLEDAPVFYPNEEEFQDTLKYIASIRPRAESYGICRIVPPSSWKPPCPLKENYIWEHSKFSTRVQRIDKLQNRDSMKKISRVNTHEKRKRRRCMRMGGDRVTASGDVCGTGEAGPFEGEHFGFEPGPEFTLGIFQKYADNFKAQYFRKIKNAVDLGGNVNILQEQWEPSVENIEGEYWRMVQKPTEEIEVLYGADLETGVFGSGFPKKSSEVSSISEEQYVKSGWNLNNFPRLPGSLLCYESGDISGVLVPWLYIGMCFSSFCWHVEDHHLYSLNYMHWGAPKLWYGVPGRDALKLEEAMRKHLPDLFDEQPDLLHKLVTQLSPCILKSEGVPVYRCIQNPGEFVLTFPRAYHSGFNCGFNCAEAVNVAPVDWLPHGQNAIELYREQGRKTSISHDKLLLGAAREAVRAQWELNLLRKNTADNLRWKGVCGKNGILAKAFKARVDMECVRREFLCNSSQAVKMESSFDATSERECCVCFFDLHLSAAACQCSPERFACLNHAKLFCSCSWNSKFFLFRNDINELNILVEALEGKLSAIYRWAKLDLGLSLSSFVSRDNLQAPEHNDKLTHSPSGTGLKEVISESLLMSMKEPKGEDFISEPLNCSARITGATSPQKEKPSDAVFALDETKSQSLLCKSIHDFEAVKQSSHFKKDGFVSLANSPFCKLSEDDTPYTKNPAAVETEVKKPSSLTLNNVIFLSDDEGDELSHPVSDKTKETSLAKNSELPDRLTGSNGKASLCNYDKEPALTTPMTNAMVMCEGDISLLSDVEKNSTGEADQNAASASSCLKHQQFGGSGKIFEENKVERIGSGACSNLIDDARIVPGSPSCSQNNLDRYFRQKGPRIAKVVRRINCNVEPLEYGIVQSGKLWCNNRAIFPKGFRSRVRYISVLDPAVMCNYVSEILDAGRGGPLFMVSLEHFPSEVFIHVSAARCWEMVRDRVNQEISKQHKLGRTKLPPLQPPGSLDGLEMFGLCSPAILQTIESRDQNRLSTEYWKSRARIQSPPLSQSEDTGRNLQWASIEQNYQEVAGSCQTPAGVDTILRGLFRKANPEELHSLFSVFSDKSPTSDQGMLTQLLSEEIHRRRR